MTTDKTEVDENLYSRQIYVLGVDAMKQLAKASILISGMGGLGVEIAKNVILAGPKSVTLHDTQNATIKDISAQFYLTPNSIGKNRALESYIKLAELNEYVSISTTTNELTNDFIRQFNCVIITEPRPYSSLMELSEFCHQNNIYFIIALTRGVFGLIFDDFGDDFFVKEPSSEKPTRFLIESISNDTNGIVTTNRKDPHGLTNENHVIFNQIEGMTELNGKEFPVKVINSTTFSIGDTSSFHPFETGSNSGYGTQVILPVTRHFKELKEAIKEPQFVEYEFAAIGRNEQVLLCYLSLFKSIEENDTSFENILKNANILNTELHIAPDGVQEQIVREFVREDCEISPTVAVIGGFAAQESIKSVSGKFLPLHMFYTMAYLEALQPIDDPSFTVTINNDRYDAYRLVFGDAQFEKMAELRYFMVGSGALGCELLKNWAMMGVATKGMIYLTDMDQIERSNLNRQFLFRNSDIGQSKSECAAKAVKEMNPDINIQAQQNRVGPESEVIYNDSFYTALSGVCNALDNVEARSYNDTQCVFYNKPLLESGTLGPMAHFQTFIPHLTKSYNSFPTTGTKGIPECTLHYFPTNINHCTMWALDVFGGLFTIQPRVVNQYINDKGYVKRMMKDDPGALIDNLTTVKKLLVETKPANYDDCVKLARLKFDEVFNHSIRDLIHLHPKDSKDNDGSPFWTEGHIFPTIITFDPSNPLHQSFISSCAFMYAKMYKIIDVNQPYQLDPNLANIAAQIETPEWTPSEQIDSKKKKGTTKKSHVNTIKHLCQDVSSSRTQENELISEEFEKDSPINGHVDFIAAAANLRASNYRIRTASMIEIKGIAGNIIPAIATATAAVCGFVSLEMYKVHSVQPKEIDDFREGYMNLADSSLQILSPAPAPRTLINTTLPGEESKQIYFTLWDKWIIEGDLTVMQFVEEFQKKYKLEVTSLAIGVILAYAPFLPSTKQFSDRKITDIYQKDAELPLIPGKMIKLTVTCDDLNGNELSTPEIYLKY